MALPSASRAVAAAALSHSAARTDSAPPTPPGPAFTGALHRLGSGVADRELAPGWARLAAEHAALPFVDPAFVRLELPLLEGGEPLVALAYRAGPELALAGVLPLVRRGRVLESLRSDHAPVFDFVGEPAALAGVWRALAADSSWDTMVLRGVPAGSALTVQLPHLALRDLSLVTVRPQSRSPYLILPGFEARLSAKHRQNLRRCERKLGAVELERVTDFSRAALDDALALEALAWKGAAGTSIDSSPALRHFYAALARLAARRGQLSLCFLRAGGRRVAFAFILEHGGAVYALKTGYDPALAALSPGHVLFHELARDAERRGLLELDFLGQDDEWKRRWTHLAHETVTLVVYRASPRGALALLGRELVKPRLPPRWIELAGRAAREIARHRRSCQRRELVGRYWPGERALRRARAGLGVRSGVRRVLDPAQGSPERVPAGAASRFATGQRVRVRPPAELRAALDENDRLRGLWFVPAQWTTAGGEYRVDRPVRRMLDDRGRMRSVSGTVLLHGVTCDIGGDELGCGRHCPLMFRDEWLEPVDPAGAEGAAAPSGAARPARWARVLPLEAIRAALDRDGRSDGLRFMPEMSRFAGARLPVVRRIERVFELGAWRPSRAPLYLLEGAHCTGADLGEEAPCDRACALLWHGDWLSIEADPGVDHEGG